MTYHRNVPNEPKAEERLKRSFWKTSAGQTLCIFLAIAGVLLWIEHRAHIFGVLPLLLPLLVCLGMHFFMHRGHSGHHTHSGDRDAR